MKKQRTLSAKLSSDWTTHSISDSMTRLRFSSAESLEADVGDCDARNRRAAAVGDEAVAAGDEAAAAAAAAGRRRGRGTGAQPKWRARRARAERGEDEEAVTARRRSRAARNADDDMVAELFGFSRGVRRPVSESRVLVG